MCIRDRLDIIDQPFRMIFESACDEKGNDLEGVTIEDIEGLDMKTFEELLIFVKDINISQKKAD